MTSCESDESEEEEEEEDPCPMKVVDNLYPLVLEAIKHVNAGKGVRMKQIFCYVRKHCDADMEDGELNCAIRGAVKKGLCKKAIKKTLFTRKYKLAHQCDVGKCTQSDLHQLKALDQKKPAKHIPVKKTCPLCPPKKLPCCQKRSPSPKCCQKRSPSPKCCQKRSSSPICDHKQSSSPKCCQKQSSSPKCCQRKPADSCRKCGKPTTKPTRCPNPRCKPR